MEQNYKMTISYDGSRYHGWERKPDTEWTVQGKLEQVLSRMTNKEVNVIGAGRTDAGVHALGMVANAFLDTAMAPKEIQEYLNRYLPEDIGITEVSLASERFHSRYNAIGKTYRYTCYVGNTKPIFERKYVYCIDTLPDIIKMQSAAELLIGEHDFKSFCGNKKMKKSTIRTIHSVQIEQKDDFITFTFQGTGFLQYMIRILTGTLLEIGWGKRDTDMSDLIAARDRSRAGFTAPPQGLCLLEVVYH